MAYDFPNTPTLGQTYSGYVWDGEKWVAQVPAAIGAVRYDLPQGLTANQTAQARANIWVTKKNYIINGAMMISQENGTTTLNPTSVNLYPVDMFGAFSANEGIAATAQVAVPTPGGSPTRLRLAVSTTDAAVGASNQLQLFTYIEGLRAIDLKLGTAAAKTVTLQFGCKGPAGTYCIAFVNAANNRSYVVEYTIAVGEANTDVIKSVTLQLDTTGTWATDNTRGLQIIFIFMGGSSLQTAIPNSWLGSAAYCTANQFNFMASTSNIFELFDVSLTEGNVAPPFQVPDYASELALCQRYFRRYGGNAAYDFAANGQCTSTTAAQFLMDFGAPLRAAPAIAITGSWGVHNASTGIVTVSGVGTTTASPQVVTLNYTVVSGLVAGNATKLFTNNDLTARLTFSARL